MNGYASVYAPATFNLTESSYLESGETCSSLAVAAPGFSPGCRVWRSCRSCLQKTGCMVNPMGSCMSQTDPMGGYNPSMSYRVAIERNVTVTNATISTLQRTQRQSWQFPALDAKYCPVDDATCAQCKQATFYQNSSDIDSRFCVGAGGCVCIFSCEYITSSALLADCSGTPAPSTYYPTSGPYSDYYGGQSDSNKTAIFAIPCVIFVVMGLVLIACIRNASARREREEQARARRHRAARVLIRTTGANEQGGGTASALVLTGWNQHRQQLVANENLRLAGAGDVDAAVYARLPSPRCSAGLAPPSTETTRQDEA